MAVTLTPPASREHFARFLFEELTRTTPLRGEAGLAHARRFVSLLGEPQDDARQVHVVGTAGKGTTAIAVTELAVASGVSVATHVSPHVYDIRERFLLDGSLAPWEEILAAADEVFHAATRLQDESGRPPTFFVAAAALAWVLGRRAGVELMVTEAGIGGKLDATNVIDRRDKITVVTNVGLDHADVLGPDVNSIARQKAEVLSRGGVVVVGPQAHPEVITVVAEVAADRDARIVVVDQQIGDWRRAAAALGETVGLELGLRRRSDTMPPALPPGRGETWEVEGRRVVLDGAHNPLKLEALFTGLECDDSREQAGSVALVAIGAGKDLSACADMIARHVSRAVVTGFDDQVEPGVHPRPWPTAVVAAALRERGVDVLDEQPDPAAAVDAAVGGSLPGQTIVVTGSFFHLAPVRDRLIELAATGMRGSI